MLTTLFVSTLVLHAPAIAVNVTGMAGVDTAEGKAVLNRFDPIPEGATVFTMAKSFLQIRLASGSQLRLGPETTVKLTALEHSLPRAKRKEGVKLMVGRLWARVTTLFGGDSRFEVETDNAVAGVRGTYILATAGGQGSSFYSVSGAVQVTAADGSAQQIASGQGVLAEGGRLGGIFELTPEELRTQLVATAGPIGPIEVQVLGLGAAPLSMTLTPSDLRGAIVGPDQVVDTQLQAGQAGATPVAGPSTVDVHVRLEVPARP